VILDDNLASIYEVTTRRLLEQVRRHPRRFPPESCFNLSLEEVACLKTSPDEEMPDSAASRPPFASSGRVPVAFTADGALMAASVLHSAPAISTSLMVASFHNLAVEFLGDSPVSRTRLSNLEKALARSDPALGKIWNTLARLRGSRESHAPPRRKQKRHPKNRKPG